MPWGCLNSRDSRANHQIAVPNFVVLVCVHAVFVPSFFMTGIPGSLFILRRARWDSPGLLLTCFRKHWRQIS
jgi:hypothetical protein